jgi:hypothetical protein
VTFMEPGARLRDRIGTLLRTSRISTGLELLLIPALLALKMLGVVHNPQLLLVLVGWLSLWLRRVGWRGVGLRAPRRWPPAIGLGVLIGIGYNALVGGNVRLQQARATA